MTIKQIDLEFLSNEEIKAFYKAEDIMLMPSPIKEFVLTGKDRYEMGNKINRVEKILKEIIVKRFIQRPVVTFTPDCKPVQTVGELKSILNTFDDGDIVVLEATDNNGDVQDLYHFYVDVIDGMELTTGGTREIRFTQIQNKIGD